MQETLTTAIGNTPPPATNSEVLSEPTEIILDDKVLYHGSATPDIGLFNPAEEVTVGRGVYFVDNPQDAAGYARIRSQRDKRPPVVYEAEISEARLVNLDNPVKLQEVMQGFASSLRQVDLSNLPWYGQGAVQRALDTIASGVRTGELKRVTQTVSGYFTDFLKSQGYDGLKTAEGGEGQEVGNHETYLIFDPDKVKVKAQQPIEQA